jgi:general secretion pathway protein I
VSPAPRIRTRARIRTRIGGFTLIEVLVALVIVAFGVGAVLAALSASAENVGALREKTLAQWVALNRISDVRLTLNPPQTGTTEGDLRSFGNGDWHWQQIITAVDQIPGLLQITVKVRRSPQGSISAGSSSTSTSSATSSSSTTGGSSGDSGNWTTTVLGFRGDALAASSGETPEWSGTDYTSTNSSSSSGGTTSGTVANPGTTTPGGSTTPTTSTPTTPTPPGSSSSGGP